jgi:hypothetical protein
MAFRSFSLLFTLKPSPLPTTTMNCEHDSTGIISAPNLRIGPEWGEHLRMCMDCGMEIEVGAVDPDDGLWSSLPPYCHDSM